jgi:hypothetical protein
MFGRGLMAALRAQMRRQFARMATVAAGFGLVIFGVGLVMVGGVFALAQQIGPIAAFCGSGAVLIVIGLIAAQAMRPRGAAPQPAHAPAGPQPPPSTEMPAAAAVVFVLGFVAIRALLRAKRGGQT